MQHHVNYTMLTDFYELTMGNGYFQTGVADQICYFDIFFRSVPDGGGFAIAAGLEQVISYIRDLHFDEEDIAYLRSKNTFSEEFLEYLRTFHFTGDIWAVPEGTPIFPREPILTVRAPAIEAQFVETYLLLTLNHQSLIATKSNRIVRAAQGKPVAEFGSRRAQGADGALLGARASYIAGASGTACAMADQMFATPATGTSKSTPTASGRVNCPAARAVIYTTPKEAPKNTAQAQAFNKASPKRAELITSVTEANCPLNRQKTINVPAHTAKRKPQATAPARAGAKALFPSPVQGAFKEVPCPVRASAATTPKNKAKNTPVEAKCRLTSTWLCKNIPANAQA